MSVANRRAAQKLSGAYRLVNFALVGPPGSGKGTYGRLLAKALKCKLVTVSDILQGHITRETVIGKKVDEFRRNGRLASDDVVSEAVLSYLRDEKIVDDDFSSQGNKAAQAGFILDGFPRTLQQVRLLEEKENFWPLHLKAHYVINIDVPDRVCLQKMLGRRICKECKKSYNTNTVDFDGFYMPPSLPRPACNCDKTITWTKRDDDREEIILKRLNEFHVETTQVISYYKEKNKLLSFVPYNGLGDMPKLEKTVAKTLLRHE